MEDSANEAAAGGKQADRTKRPLDSSLPIRQLFPNLL